MTGALYPALFFQGLLQPTSFPLSLPTFLFIVGTPDSGVLCLYNSHAAALWVQCLPLMGVILKGKLLCVISKLRGLIFSTFAMCARDGHSKIYLGNQQAHPMMALKVFVCDW